MMKLHRFTLAITAIATSVVASAGQFSTSSNINVLAFDGQKVKKNHKVQIQDSQPHQVVVEVSSIYHSGSDNAFFESKPIIVTFNGSGEDVNLIAPHLRTGGEVEQFKKQPHFKLQTASGKLLDYKQDYLQGEGFMPSANLTANLADYNASGKVASVKQLASAPMAMAMPINNKASKGKVMVQGENIAEQQLQYWFQQADKATQKRFLDWAKQQ